MNCAAPNLPRCIDKATARWAFSLFALADTLEPGVDRSPRHRRMQPECVVLAYSPQPEEFSRASYDWSRINRG
jgi:hypothetical protein